MFIKLLLFISHYLNIFRNDKDLHYNFVHILIDINRGLLDSDGLQMSQIKFMLRFTSFIAIYLSI